VNTRNSEHLHQQDIDSRIRQRIDDLTGRQVRQLVVQVTDQRITVSGLATCYYHKQLAIRGVFDTLGSANGFEIDLQIRVVGDTGDG
jgi:hypothetical protein